MALRRIWTLLRRSAFRRPQDDRDIDEELRFHLAQETQLRIDRGARADDAERGARLALGSVARVKEDTRAVWVASQLEQLLQDVRSGCRILTSAPLLTATAVILVTLVIGGNATVFSIAHAILHEPAPGVRASGLVKLAWVRDDGGLDPGVSYSKYEAIAAETRTLQPLTAFDGQRFALGHRTAGTHALWGALVTAGHFSTVDAALALGRPFSESESRGSASGLTAVISHRVREQGRTPLSALVNQALADALWPGESPVGRRLRTSLEGTRSEVEIVGIAPDASFGGYRDTTRALCLLLSWQQDPHGPGEVTFYVRHAGSATSAGASVRRLIHDVDPAVPIVHARPLAVQLESSIWPVRMLTTLLGFFAGGSLLIAAIGQYAVVAFDTRRRFPELGLRMALGASSAQVLWSVFRDGLRLTVIGLAIGFVLSLGAGYALRGLLYGVTPTDALTYAGVFAMLMACSLVACSLPARQAARLDPVRVLRFE